MKPTIEKFRKLVSKLASKKYRDAYVDAQINNGLAFQIREMRQSRGWTQKLLAEKIGTKQTGICRMENPDQSQFSIATLKKIASAYDVALMVRFVSFSELAGKTCDLKIEDIDVPSFDQDAGLHGFGTDKLVSNIDSKIKVTSGSVSTANHRAPSLTKAFISGGTVLSVSVAAP